MALPLTISGLGSDRYLFNNPIWVDVTDMGIGAKYLNILITRNDNNKSVGSRLYIYNDLSSLDISEHIKGLCDYPHFPTGVLLDGQEINTNYYEFTFSFSAYDENGILKSTGNTSKTFIRGGFETQETNISIPNNTILKDSVLLPQWNGYDFNAFRLVNNKIVVDNTITNIDDMQLIGCNPLYIRFLNMLGGYSYWLFENWEVSKKSAKTKVINRRSQDISTGHKVSYTLSVESRIDRKYLKLIRALTQSPEVAVLGLSNKIDAVSGFISGLPKWEQIWNNGNSTSIDAFQITDNIKLKFDYILKMKPQTIW